MPRKKKNVDSKIVRDESECSLKEVDHEEHQDHMIPIINVWNVVLRIRRTCIFVMISKKRKRKSPDVICFTMKRIIVPTQHVMMTLMTTRMMTTNTIT